MIWERLQDPNLQWVLAGCILLGISSGVLGSFAFLRRRSLMGDALAHAALPGVCLAFLVFNTRSPGVLLLGAVVTGLLGAWCIQAISRHTRLKEDTGLGLVLSVFFGFGIVLLTFIQRTGRASQAGLDKIIFGQAASMVGEDVRWMAICAAVVCLAAILLFKEFKLLCFDPGFASGIGLRVSLLDGLLLLLIVLAVVVGLQSVGVVLMAAMLITPAAAARFWTDRLNVMVALSGTFGAASGALGTVFSLVGQGMPTGPLIVLAATLMFLFSLLAAPRRGLLARGLRLVQLRARVGREHVLRALYEMGEARGTSSPAVTLQEVAAHRGQAPAQVAGAMQSLTAAGWVRREGDCVRLTEAGVHQAYQVVRNHRLWEMFLMHEGQLGADHVDRDADFIEHHLSPDIVAELERLLQVHGRVPELPPSVHPLPAGGSQG